MADLLLIVVKMTKFLLVEMYPVGKQLSLTQIKENAFLPY